MKKIYFALLGVLLTLNVSAQDSLAAIKPLTVDSMQTSTATVERYTKSQGDSAYINSDYLSAIEIYETLLSEGEAMELYYNLGNSYYKAGDIARAILNYERALLLSPSNDDVRANLEIARSKTVDKIDATPEIFFVTWIKTLINLNSINTWAVWGVVFFMLFIVGAYFFIFSKHGKVKKIGFIGALVFLVLMFGVNLFAAHQKENLTDRSTAIVLSPSVVVRSTPTDNGTTLFVVHEGTKVTIKDDTMKNWKEIVLQDGKVGWVEVNDIEVI